MPIALETRVGAARYRRKPSPAAFWAHPDRIARGQHADQSGMVGLVRRLHGLGVAIAELKVIP
jgi:hypothetical protein